MHYASTQNLPDLLKLLLLRRSSRKVTLGLLVLSIFASAARGDEAWTTFITPRQLHERLASPRLLIVDVRSEAEYAAGHIPGAINLPGSQWRTPENDKAGGKRVFRGVDGALDVARYERLLGSAGITADRDIVIYGNTAGKADGSVPAAILVKLGHQHVAFLDGVGLDQWRAAGYETSQEKPALPTAKYVARPAAAKVWSREDVLSNLDRDDVVFIDSRTAAEYAGRDLRGNRRGGHIPGAVSLDSELFLDKASGTTISREAARAKVESLIPRGKKVVVYCQSGTRCSHEELILKDLGYENVILYDASWQEWGNRDDSPIATPETSGEREAQSNSKNP